MSGESILIEQLRADVSQLRDDRADLQERCDRLSAEKAEALRMLAEAERERDAYKRAKEENDERFMRERDEWKARHDTLADVSRACIATAERERAERDALHVALELAEVEVALDRSWCRICRTECRGAHRGRREHMHATECVLNIRAHAAKAVKP